MTSSPLFILTRTLTAAIALKADNIVILVGTDLKRLNW